jgi:hypothetical protein
MLLQINQNEVVFDLGSKLLNNWDMCKAYKRDLLLSLVVANCNVARDLLAEQKVSWTDDSPSNQWLRCRLPVLLA